MIVFLLHILAYFHWISIHFKFHMFGATKGPNSSQYDFKGTSVLQPLFSWNHLPLLINPHLPELEELVVEEQLEDLNLTKEEGSAISFKIKLTNSKVPNTETPWQLKIPITLNKILRNSRKKSTLFLKSALD